MNPWVIAAAVLGALIVAASGGLAFVIGAAKLSRNTPPVPGDAPPREAVSPPSRPSPAPGLPPHPPSPPGHPPGRRIRKRIDVLLCGCTYVYDGRDKEWNVITCATTAVDWDAELRRLAP